MSVCQPRWPITGLAINARAGDCVSIKTARLAPRESVGIELICQSAYSQSMIQSDCEFLPGVPSSLVLKRLNAAGGNEVNSGKLSSPESSAALAVNTFGWFIEQPELLPAFPMVQVLNWPATQIGRAAC